jgi:hypothetical protein
MLPHPNAQHDTHMRDRLKCNRGSPCDTCVKRNKQSSCEYAGNANRDTTKHSNTGDRLQNLENIVLQFVQNGVTGELQDRGSDNISKNMDRPGGCTTADINTPTDARGTLHVRGGQMNYVDSSHWLSILHDIKEVREQLSLSNSQVQDDQPFADIRPQPEVDLMFGPLQPLTVPEIIRSLPPRHVCDSLISQFFNSKYMILRTSPHSLGKMLYLLF